ncbi:unnamed protein product [Polarella glacialis]|uniref:Guanine nucleotide-binding protein subunit beta-like protein n=1 Tax=Polarella glacialis TaxID=89957 RepID=A0A813EEH7_POLGL|nr:unnamed protein product [Polarella glacialis]
MFPKISSGSGFRFRVLGRTVGQRTSLSRKWWALYAAAAIEIELAASTTTLKGHSNPVTALCVYNDTLCSGSRDNTIRLWDLTSNTCTTTLKEGHSNYVNALCVYNDTLCSGSRDNTIRLWDLTSNTCTTTLKEGHSNYVNALCVWNDTLCSGSHDGELRLWDLTSNTCTTTLKGHSNYVTALCVYNDTLCSGSYDSTIRLWDLTSNTCTTTLKGHSNYVTALCVYNDTLCSGSLDSTIRLWDLTSNTCTTTLKKATATRLALCVYNDTLCSGSEIHYQALGPHIQHLHNHPQRPQQRSQALCVYNDTLCSGSDDKTIRLWDLTTKPVPPAASSILAHWRCVLLLRFTPPQVALEEEEEVALEEEEVALEKEEEEGCPKFLKWRGRSPSSSRSPRCRSDSCWRQSPLSVQCLTPSGRTSAQFATFWRSCGQIPASAQRFRI